MLAEFGTGQVFWSMLWFFFIFIEIWLLIMVFSDIFRSHDLNGWGKALWTIFVILLPILGVLVYLIARGGKMAEHAVETAQAQDAAAQAYIKGVVASSPTDELARLADLKAQGVLTGTSLTMYDLAISGAPIASTTLRARSPPTRTRRGGRDRATGWSTPGRSV